MTRIVVTAANAVLEHLDGNDIADVIFDNLLRAGLDTYLQGLGMT